MRTALVACCVVAAAAVTSMPAAGAVDARLQGTWAMKGRVTRAHGVRGEHRGQRVTRKWTFASSCASGPCSTVILMRERSKHQIERLVLRRTGSGRYAGHGSFFVRLRCGSKTYDRGGIAYTTIQLTIKRSAIVQASAFATAIQAVYKNPRRVNRTPCPGSLGRDGGTYSGGLSSALPAPPAADFSASANPVTGTDMFSDASHASSGASIAAWSWNFGDPASGGSNTSTDANPTHHYGTPGSYTVTLTVTDSNGLTSAVSHQVVG